MPREGDEVGTDRSHVHHSVRNELRGVDDDDGLSSVRRLDDRAEVVHGAEDVRHGRDCDHAGAVDELVQV